MEQLVFVADRELVRLAKITSVFGIKGGVKLTPLFLSAEELSEILKLYPDNVYLYLDNIFPKTVKFKDLTARKKTVSSIIHGVDSLKKAKPCVGMYLTIDKDKYCEYIEDTDSVLRYIGYRLKDKHKGDLGTVSGLIRTYQTLLELTLKNGEKVLIPFVKQLIEEIDVPAKIIKMDLPEGLL